MNPIKALLIIAGFLGASAIAENLDWDRSTWSGVFIWSAIGLWAALGIPTDNKKKK